MATPAASTPEACQQEPVPAQRQASSDSAPDAGTPAVTAAPPSPPVRRIVDGSGLVLEVTDDGGVVVNAKHLVLKCSNGYMIAAAKAPAAATPAPPPPPKPAPPQLTPAEKRAARIKLGKHVAKRAGLASGAAAAAALLMRAAGWHWVRMRAQLALRVRSTDLLVYLLASPNRRVVRAALARITDDARDANTRHLLDPAAAQFPTVPDTALGRKGALRPGALAAASCEGSEKSWAGSSSSASSGREALEAPADVRASVASLSIKSCSVSCSSTSLATPRAGSPAVCLEAAIALDDGGRPRAAVPSPLCPSASVANLHYKAAAPDAAADKLPARTTAAKAAPPARAKLFDARAPPPQAGHAVAMLLECPGVFAALTAALRRMLLHADRTCQRDAARTIQVLAFSGDRIAQGLVDAGIVPLLVDVLRNTHGTRMRGEARLRQPSPAPNALPNPAALLQFSPLYLPQLHISAKARTCTVTPRGMNLAFLGLFTRVGQALSSNGLSTLVPGCGAERGKRQAAAEALQNLVALRAGARELLKHEDGLPVLCASMYTNTALGRLAAVETVHSLIAHFPSCRNRVYSAAGDHAISWVSYSCHGSMAAQEACTRALCKLRPDRAALPSDYDDGHSMYC